VSEYGLYVTYDLQADLDRKIAQWRPATPKRMPSAAIATVDAQRVIDAALGYGPRLHAPWSNSPLRAIGASVRAHTRSIDSEPGGGIIAWMSAKTPRRHARRSPGVVPSRAARLF
jgi:hypothetical protein